jgi:anti-anti-sigma factor
MNKRPIALNDVQKDAFQTWSEQRGDAIVVRMRGNADIDAQEQLKHFLDRLHTEAKRLAIQEMVFELQELYFMNSSCLSLLLRHVNAILESPSHAYHLTFRSNPNLRWQKRSFQALQSYAPELINLE